MKQLAFEVLMGPPDLGIGYFIDIFPQSGVIVIFHPVLAEVLIVKLAELRRNPGRKVEIPDEDAKRILTVQNAVDYIKERGVEDE